MIQILSSDRTFTDSPNIGDSRCICSRCGERIKNSREGAIRGWEKEKNLEYRFHYRCLGIEKSEDPDWDDEEYPEEYDPDCPYPEIEEVSLGTCCVCRSEENVFNIINLPYRTFIPGTIAWSRLWRASPSLCEVGTLQRAPMPKALSAASRLRGNFATGLPADGAVAVVCNDCLEEFDMENLRDVVYGYGGEKQRRPFLEVTKQGDFGVEEFL